MLVCFKTIAALHGVTRALRDVSLGGDLRGGQCLQQGMSWNNLRRIYCWSLVLPLQQYTRQEAQLSQRDRASLLVIEYFAKTFETKLLST